MEMDEISKSLWFGSDFHYERYSDRCHHRVMIEPIFPEKDQFDFIALAGDIAHSLYIPLMLNAVQQKAGCPVFYTPGNHEFYDGRRRGVSMAQQIEEMRDGCDALQNVHFLFNEGMDLEGTNTSIFGSPLFTDFGWFADQSRIPEVGRMIADYGTTLVDGELLVPENHILMHEMAVSSLESWLENTISRGRTPLIMTHWGPSRMSSHDHYPRDTLIASYFCTDYLDRMKDIFPEGTTWIHGHTHWNVSYQLGNVFVDTNQFGYRGEAEANETFSPNKYVEVY